MIKVLQELQEKQNVAPEGQEIFSLNIYKTYNRKELDEYLGLYRDLENILKVHLPFQKEYDTFKTRTVDGYFSVYQAESYITEEASDEMNLSQLGLKDAHFFSHDVEKIHLLHKLKVINLSYNQIFDVNFIIFSEKSPLREFYISHNNLFSLKSIENLQNLEVLDVSFNSLNNLKKESFTCLKERTSLKYLNLSTNELIQDGDFSGSELSVLKNLTFLDLSQNSFGQIDFLSKLTHLITLNLSHNQIQTLASLSTLTCLTHLNASHNQLEGLVTKYFPSPSEAATPLGLVNLQFLDLSNNKGLKFSPSNSLLKKEHYKQFLPNIIDLKTAEGDEFFWE